MTQLHCGAFHADRAPSLQQSWLDSVAGSRQDDSQMKVLVVEDDPRISDVLEYALKTDGYEVVKAQRGREAIEIAQRSAPALIVLDVGLPDIDGFEVCRSIRKS